MKATGIRDSRGRVIDTKSLRTRATEAVAAGVMLEGPQGLHVPPDVAMALIEDAWSRGEVERLAVGAEAIDGWYMSGFKGRRGRLFRLAVLSGASDVAQEAILRAVQYGRELGQSLIELLGLRPKRQWVETIGPVYAEPYLREIARASWEHLRPSNEETIETVLAMGDAETRMDLGRYFVLHDESERALELDGLPKYGKETLEFLAAFWAGRYVEACELGDAVVESLKRKHKQLRGLEGVCHALARVAASGSRKTAWEGLKTSIERAGAAKAGFSEAYGMLSVFCGMIENPERRDGRSFYLGLDPDWVSLLVFGLTGAWLPKNESGVDIEELCREVAGRARDGGFHPVAAQFEPLTKESGKKKRRLGGLAGAYRPRASWEFALDTLSSIAEDAMRNPSGSKEPSERHIVWEVFLLEDGIRADIQPRLIASERSKKGKLVAVSRLLEGKGSCLTDADRRVLTHAEDPWEGSRGWGRGGRATGAVLRQAALPSLIGHPHVVDEDGEPLSVVRGEPGLSLEPRGERWVLRLDPAALGRAEVAHRRDGAVVHVFERPEALERVAAALGTGELEVPEEGRARLTEALAKLGAKVPVRSGDTMKAVGERVEADSRIVVLLSWDGSVLDVKLRVAPLGLAGPKVLPGRGSEELLAETEGRLRVTERTLERELENLERLRSACPTLSSLEGTHGEVAVLQLDDALEVLTELDAMGEAVVLAWPEQRKLSMSSVRGPQALQMKVRQGVQWLHVEVGVQVDARRVLSYRELIERREQGSRFVRIGDNEFIGLTEELRKRLDALEGLGPVRKGQIEASGASLALIDELSRDAGKVEMTPPIRKRLETLRQAEHKTPRVPRNFSATLRDYQHEGFVWMARLAELGLGACLADDMGLGKTIQALAILCARAKLGPALVVAPTSVVHNWQEEMRRFAPSLRAHVLAQSDRESTIAEATSRDVLLCSYGIFVRYAASLSKVEFSSVVFDEAHVLKNAQTQRAKAATRLQAGFRMSLTGTPIENHLGEFWSVMNVTVPGLLRTERHFEERFASPIRNGQRERAHQLRALVRPFVLRRTTAQVLDELPPREEIKLEVVPSKDERAFYEALRRRAVDRLNGEEKRKNGGAARVQVLAEIMKLRQAAVDPRLVDPDSGPAGSKLDVLVERVTALRDEGHRALVFSQFLGSMKAVKERLEGEGLEVLSLDGSTPAKQRADLVEAFQNGEADVFVMSLKAGGVGVNLTAADYVFHLDPWWNPAVEDQATGRAHRIGQERPVTVYRLVTRGTIEEKILALHDSKRALAEDLLEGLEAAKKLDLEELRALLET